MTVRNDKMMMTMTIRNDKIMMTIKKATLEMTMRKSVDEKHKMMMNMMMARRRRPCFRHAR